MILTWPGSHMFTGSYVTVPAPAQPLPADIMNGFSLSAWVQPQPNTNGYILAKTSADGLKHFYSLKLLTSTSSSTIELALARSNTVWLSALSLGAGYKGYKFELKFVMITMHLWHRSIIW